VTIVIDSMAVISKDNVGEMAKCNPVNVPDVGVRVSYYRGGTFEGDSGKFLLSVMLIDRSFDSPSYGSVHPYAVMDAAVAAVKKIKPEDPLLCGLTTYGIFEDSDDESIPIWRKALFTDGTVKRWYLDSAYVVMVADQEKVRQHGMECAMKKTAGNLGDKFAVAISCCEFPAEYSEYMDHNLAIKRELATPDHPFHLAIKRMDARWEVRLIRNRSVDDFQFDWEMEEEMLRNISGPIITFRTNHHMVRKEDQK